MNIFLICPVRSISDEYLDGIKSQVDYLESLGNEVYWPYRDTNQDDLTGYNICISNKEAIERCDVVYVIWDGKSQGCLFDLGMAFALGKSVKTITGYMPQQTNGKSFQNMIFYWEELLY
jgi:nucleoside 2-deoxyribosyltransferase